MLKLCVTVTKLDPDGTEVDHELIDCSLDEHSAACTITELLRDLNAQEYLGITFTIWREAKPATKITVEPSNIVSLDTSRRIRT